MSKGRIFSGGINLKRLKVPSAKLVINNPGPIENLTVRRNHIVLVVIELLHCTKTYQHIDRQTSCFFNR